MDKATHGSACPQLKKRVNVKRLRVHELVRVQLGVCARVCFRMHVLRSLEVWSCVCNFLCVIVFLLLPGIRVFDYEFACVCVCVVKRAFECG